MDLYIENIKHETFAEANETVHCVYAHGLLEEKAGYDIVCYSEKETFDFRNDRIEDVVTVMPDGERIKSKLFFWHSKPEDIIQEINMRKDPVYLCHGLIVAKTDAEALKDAKRKYKEKRRWI